MSEKTIRVLLVEHSTSDARHVRKMLDDAAQADPTIPAFDLTRATKLSTAQRRLSKENVDVVLLALPLPDTQGLEGFTALHAEQPEIPIVVLSDPAHKDLAVAAEQQGARDHLVKGKTDGDLLVRSMRYAIEGGQAEKLLRIQRDLCILLVETGDLDESMGRLLQSAVQVDGIDCGGVYLVDQPTGNLDLIAHTGLPPEFIKRVFHYDADAPQARLAMQGEPVHQLYPEILQQGKDRVRRQEGLRAMAVLPVKHEGQVIAVLNLASHTHDEIPATAREAIETIAARIGGVVTRVRAEQALRRSKARLKLALEAANEGLYDWNMQTGEAYFSPRYCTMLGYEPDEIQPSYETWLGLIHPDDRELALDVVKEYGQKERGAHEIAYRLRTKTGEWRWILNRGRAAESDEAGTPTRIVGTHVDITEQKQAEEALIRLQSAVEQTDDGIAIGDLDGNLQFVNPAWARMHGYAPEELLGAHLSIFHTEQQLREVVIPFNETVLEVGTKKGEVNHIAKDGTVFPTMMTSTLLRDNQGDPMGMVATARDITEQKQAEEALRAERDFGAGMLDALTDTVFAFDPQTGRPLRWNRAFSAISGYTDEEIAAKKIPDDWYSAQDLEKAAAPTEKLLKGEKAVFEMALLTKDGREIPTEYSTAMVEDAKGDPEYVIAVGRDITQRKLVDAALLRATREWEEIFQAIGHPTLVLDPQHGIIAANRAAGEMLGQPQEQIIGRRCCEVFHGEDDPPDYCPLKSLIDCSGTEPVEMEMEALGGMYLISCTPVPDEQGELEKVIHIATDITDLKRAEGALRRERDLGNRVMETSPAGIAVIKRDGRITFANVRAEQVLGLTEDEITRRTHNDPKWRITDRDGNPFPEEQLPFSQVIASGQSVFDVQHAIEWPNGKRVLLSINAAPILDEAGQVDGVVATVEDITERIRSRQERARAEKALRESEGRFRALVQNSSDITVVLEPDRTVRYASPALERILGYEPNAIMGDNPFDYVHPDDVETMLAQLTETMAHPGIPVSSEFRLRHADGSWLYVETIGNNLLDQPGIEGIVVNARDITERKRAEKALLENERFLQDVFDGIQDGISVLDSDLNVVRTNAWMDEMYSDKLPLTNKKCYEAYQERDTTCPWCPCLSVLETGEIHTEIVPYPSAENPAGWMELTGYPLRNDNGQVTGVIEHVKNITKRIQAEEARARSRQQIEQLNRLQSDLLGPHSLTEKLDAITEGVVSIFGADFARIWIIRPGDLCDGNCIHAEATEGPHVCRHRDKCLHLLSSSGRYSHIDGEMHRRVPFGCYKIGRVAAGKEPKFVTNNVLGDPRVHDHEWARELGLVSFAGYRLKSTSEEIIGVLALFSKHALSPDEDALLEGLANTTAQIVQSAYAEEALERSEATLRSIFRVAPVGIGLVSDRVLLWVNDLICEALGYSSDELVGKSARVLYPSDADYEYVGQEKYAQIAERGTGTVETRWQRKDGKRIDILLSSTPIDPSDLSKGVTFTALDITERVRSEQEREKAENERQLLLTRIQAQAQQLQQVMDTVPAGVILLDDRDCIVLANPLGTKHLAILADTLVGGTLTHLGIRPLPAVLTSPPQGLWHDIAAEGREFQVIARPIETGPSPAGWVLVIRDVTEQRGIERRSQQQERLASLGQLAAGIAHDFNNIMAVITLYASMSLRAPDVHPKIAERLEVIDQQARRASELIEQIMDFSRRAVLERGPMDLLAFAKEQAKLLQRTLPESIRVNLTYGKDDYMIRADPTRIQQVMMNLGTNARDAMPEGGRLHIILDRVQIERGTPPPMPEMDAGHWICLKMADTGTGIPQDVLPHIFDPFFTTKQPGSGTGLGLAQVYGIVKQHEGHIDVHTSDKEGTTFVIYLPALTVEPPEVLPSRVQELPQGEGETILVVEDDTTARAAIVSSLELLGYQVVESANGQEALEAYEQHASEIDLVLSDMVMPEMGGRVLFRQLSKQRADVKVILMSGHPLEEAALEELRAEGLTGWLPKPPGLAKLAEVVSQALAQDGSAHEPSS